MKSSLQQAPIILRLRVAVSALLGAALLATVPLAPAAAAAPLTVTDWLTGSAVIPPGQLSPVQVDPADLTLRADGAIGLGYHYRATGNAVGPLQGSFVYQEHGYLYFKNPADPTTLVGSQFVSGVFTISADGGKIVRVADTAPAAYTSGIQTVAMRDRPHVSADRQSLLGHAGQLTYGYFTFTDPQGTFTGYATPDFTHFVIGITFAAQ